MTYQEAKNTEDAKNWTIRMVSDKFQPVYKRAAVGIAHDTLDAARIFITCQIACNTPEQIEWATAEKNRLYRDFDLC